MYLVVYLTLTRPVGGRKALAGAAFLVLPCVENMY
jgi:hypothetical protein